MMMPMRAIHHWFIQERHKGTPISGVLVMENARLLYQQLYPGKSDDFKAGSGWLHRLKKRHGIRQLSMQGESLSADVGASEEFRSFFHKFV